jgi:hypothetical protein
MLILFKSNNPKLDKRPEVNLKLFYSNDYYSSSSSSSSSGGGKSK